MNILFVTYDLPYPLTSGGKIRAYHLIKQLANKHEVTLVTFYRSEQQLASLQDLGFVKKIYTFKRRNLYSPLNLLYLPSLPFPAALYYDPAVIQKVKEIIVSSSFDTVHLESFYSSIFLDCCGNIPVVLGTENIEWKVYEEYLKQQFVLLKPLLQFEVDRIKEYEEKTWQKSTYCMAVSEDNAKHIEQVSGKQCEVIANGVDLAAFAHKKAVLKNSRIRFLFIGSMRYIQNRDAISWLLSSIWPKIKEKVVELGRVPELSIIGPDTHTLVNSDSSVTIHGEVGDIHAHYNNTDVLLAPIRAGSGTKFKVLEAMASGIPVITTSIGIEGIEELSDKNEVLVANDESAFVDAVSYLLSNTRKIESMTVSARHIVEKYYSWDAIGRKLLSFYETVIDHHRQL